MEHKYSVGDEVYMYPREAEPMVVLELVDGWRTGQVWPCLKVRCPDGRIIVISENSVYQRIELRNQQA